MLHVTSMTTSRRFRIVHAIAQLRYGAGRYVVDTAIAQHRREPGRVAVVLSADADGPWRSSQMLIDELVNADVPVFHCGDFFHRDRAGLMTASQALRATIAGIDEHWSADCVVHAHTAMAAAVARWAGAPRVVLTCHGWGPNRPDEFDLQDALAYSLCDVVTSPSEHWASVVREKTGRPDVAVVPYGFNFDRMQPTESGNRTRSPRVVFVGELSHRKGVDLLLEAMPAVWTRVPDAELHVVGGGEQAAELREQARALDGSGLRVIFHGHVDDPALIVSNADVFALASRSDNLPVAIIEAMAMGLPVVATRVGGVAELVEGARCGFVVPPENAFELSMAICTLLETSARGRRELGADGAAYVRANCDIAEHIGGVSDLYGHSVAHTRQVPASSGFATDSPIRLHIGCDTEHRDGWVNIDTRAEVSPDVVARAHELTMFADSSVDEIEACHLLEHLPLHEAQAAIREWARVLRPGGSLLLELPNFEACIRLLGVAKDAAGYDLAMLGIFGWPPAVTSLGESWAHHWGWSPGTLGAELSAAGFGDIERVPVTQTWRLATSIDRDFRLQARKLAVSGQVAA